MRTENAKFAKRSDRVVHTAVHTFWGRSFILPSPYFSRIHRCDRPLVTFLQMGTDFACKRILGPCAWLCAPIRPHELYPPAPTLRHAAPRDGRCWPSYEVRCAWRRFLRAAHLQGWGMHDQPSWVPGPARNRASDPPLPRVRGEAIAVKDPAVLHNVESTTLLHHPHAGSPRSDFSGPAAGLLAMQLRGQCHAAGRARCASRGTDFSSQPTQLLSGRVHGPEGGAKSGLRAADAARTGGGHSAPGPCNAPRRGEWHAAVPTPRRIREADLGGSWDYPS